MTIQYHIEEETPHNSSRVYVRFPNAVVPDYQERVLKELSVWNGADKRIEQSDDSVLMSWEFKHNTMPTLRRLLSIWTTYDDWKVAPPMEVWIR